MTRIMQLCTANVLAVSKIACSSLQCRGIHSIYFFQGNHQLHTAKCIDRQATRVRRDGGSVRDIMGSPAPYAVSSTSAYNRSFAVIPSSAHQRTYICTYSKAFNGRERQPGSSLSILGIYMAELIDVTIYMKLYAWIQRYTHEACKLRMVNDVQYIADSESSKERW